MTQMGLLGDQRPDPPGHRVRALAGVLAGFRWPGRGSYEKLTRPQRAAAETAARRALDYLAEEDD